MTDRKKVEEIFCACEEESFHKNKKVRKTDKIRTGYSKVNLLIDCSSMVSL